MARGGLYVLCTCIIATLQITTVSAQSNDPPVWVEDLVDRLVTRGLDEDSLLRSVVGRLLARDPEGQRVTYNVSSSGNIFSINSETGELSLIAPLDREKRARHDTSVYARDDVGNVIVKRYETRVRDINDNSPTIMTPPGGLKAHIWQDASMSSVVISEIRVIDRDIGKNAAVTLSCYVPEEDEGAQEACNIFEIRTRQIGEGSYLGSVVLRRKLGRDPLRAYMLTLAAVDGGTPPLSSYATVMINVRDRGDALPRFTNTPVKINIFEGIGRDTEVGKLKVHDGGLGASKPLRIKIAQGEDGQGWFRLGRPRSDNSPNPLYTVPIYSNGNIDRESWDGVYEFDVEAIELVDGKETSSRARTTVSVTIRDRNDNGPKFVPTNTYDITVPEGLGVNTQLPGLDMIVRDADEGTNSMFRLTLEDDVYQTFSLSQSECTGECAVSLVVMSPRQLDYEVPRYRQQTVLVVARESKTSEQRSSTGTVTIRLQDRNDNAPVFTQTQYSRTLREDRRVGSLVATIRASDSDSGDFGTIRYRLVTGDTFSVNDVTGEIHLMKALDFERMPTLSLTYEAKDLGGRFTRVPFVVTVLNLNDQGPVFVRDNYDVVINEGTTRLLINVTAVDKEQSGRVTYRISSGNTPDNAFFISRFTGVISLVRPVTFEDTGGRGYFRLTVEASDSGNPPQTTSIPITITIKDVDNRPPFFSQSLYAGFVSEIASSGLSVVTVKATDVDTGVNGQIRYQIARGSFNNFNIDSTSGIIRVSRTANLDLQVSSSSYRMIVQAVDGGSPPLTGDTQVTITVKDANNKAPRFVQDVYLTSLLESSLPGTSILQLVATDPDSNRDLEYSLQRDTVSAKNSDGQDLNTAMLAKYRDAFSVNSRTGTVQSRRTLSRDEVGEVSFIAQVRDRNAQVPAIQTATATVIVTVESAKQQQLEFSPPLMSDNPDIRVTVPEEEGVGYLVHTLVALNPNTNRPISNYEKVSGTDPLNYFFVDRSSGRITLNRRLDYEWLANQELSLQVRATTTGSNILSAVARIIVTVRDINDNSPVFSQSSYQFSVREGQQFPMQTGVHAVDADSGEFGEIRYTLTGKGRQLFFINPVTGTISVARNATLDRESIEGGEFDLLVKATDNPDGRASDQRQTDVPLTIVVEDVNDNAPVFAQMQYNLYTRDNARAGTALGTVSATDADVEASRTITYSLTTGNTDDLFLIDRTTGVIRNQRDLAGYSKLQPYELMVVARDNGFPPLASGVKVNIFVSDLQGNDDIPRIIAPSKDGEVFKVPEDAGPGTNVTWINAVARGSSASGTVFFRFLDNPLLRDQTYFRINPLTGVISLIKPLDRESQQQYQLIVVVENKLAATENKRSLFVNVTDVDDNKPSFLTCPGIHVNPIETGVDEEGPMVMDVIQLKACDLDAPPNNRVYYYIVKGNDPLPGSTTPPFSIDRSTGLLRTRQSLDREVSTDFLLYVKVSSDPALNVTGYIVNATLGSVQMVRVTVRDIDDNGPSFGGDTTFSTGVVATARYGTKLLIVTARDQDIQAPFATSTYAITDTRYYREGSDPQDTPGAFIIEPRTGLVRTYLPDYLDYQHGYFRMVVTATDQKGRSTSATLFIYVIRETQRLKFNFNIPPEQVAKIRTEFMSKVNMTLGDDIRVNDDSIHYHMDDDDSLIQSSTDLCFHMVKDNRVVQPEVALRILDNRKDQLDPIYREYSVNNPGLCSVKAVTYTWSDHYWLWWILIALTLLIMLISLILICCLCFCCKRPVSEPYVNLDPEMDYIPNKEYEWQQRTVKME